MIVHDQVVLDCTPLKQCLGDAVHLGRVLGGKPQVESVDKPRERRPLVELFIIGNDVVGHSVNVQFAISSFEGLDHFMHPTSVDGSERFALLRRWPRPL